MDQARKTLLCILATAAILQSYVHAQTTPPTCSARCMVDSMFVTQCVDTKCLCQEKTYQQSLFQCLYSQCDSSQYGPALGYTISLCLGAGAEISMAPPGRGGEHDEADAALRAREADYLAGRELAEVPGMPQLREESVAATPGGFQTVSITVSTTMSFTTTVPADATPTPFFSSRGNGSDAAAAAAAVSEATPTPSFSRPWMITSGAQASRMPSSFAGLVLWLGVLLARDLWVNGYW